MPRIYIHTDDLKELLKKSSGFHVEINREDYIKLAVDNELKTSEIAFVVNEQLPSRRAAYHIAKAAKYRRDGNIERARFHIEQARFYRVYMKVEKLPK